MDEYSRAQEEHELKRAAWKELFKASQKKRHLAPERPDGDEPVEPKLRRLIVNDATFEALHQTMSENPAGVLVIRDELTGWLAEVRHAPDDFRVFQWCDEAKLCRINRAF